MCTIFGVLLGTTSNVNTVTLISDITGTTDIISTTGILTSIEPTIGIPSSGKLATLQYKLLVLCISRYYQCDTLYST